MTPKAVFLIHDLRPGGAERVCLQYVNHLRRIEPVLVLVRRNLDLATELRPGVTILDLNNGRGDPGPGRPRITGVRPAALAARTLRLRRIVRETNAAIVSTFLHKSHVLGFTARAFGRPYRLVVNVHEMSQFHRFHHPPVDRALLAAFMRHAFPRADRIVAVAQGVRDDLTGTFGIPADRVTVVPNPIDTERIRDAAREEPPEPWFRSDSPPCIVAAGRLAAMKGFDILIRAVAGIGMPGVRLVILGEGEERPRLEACARDGGIADRVHLVGWRPNPWSYMARADIVVLSSHTEAFPGVIGEALALGRPSVATDCSPGVREYLRNGRCGMLVPPGDVGALGQALQRMLASPALREQYAGEARAIGLPHALEAAVRHYEDVLLATLS
jgi:glycosyltransferase involved in cell wall biosynthesis